jgi:hypothetical protein
MPGIGTGRGMRDWNRRIEIMRFVKRCFIVLAALCLCWLLVPVLVLNRRRGGDCDGIFED